MKRWLIIFLLFSFCGYSYANSLWNDQSRSSFKTVKNRKVGELITVIVEEDSSALQKGDTQSDRNGGFDMGLDLASQGIGTNKPKEGFNFGFGFNGKSDFRGKAKTSRATKVKAMVTAVITEVKTNGNLFVVGQRNIGINAEQEKIFVSGIVRPEDITAENTVFSYQIAEAQIKVQGEGSVSNPQKPGLLSRLFGWLF